jgi:cellulose biosynthesis protein BcsQ
VKVLALYSIKGGVGKTTAAVALAWLAAREGIRTLLWDLDPQAAATWTFRIRPKVKGGSRRLVRRKKTLERLIKGTDYERLDLLPADFSYRHLDIVLDGTKKPTGRLRKLLKPLGSEYDLVFLDCPPGISLVSEAVFGAADALLVPLIPSPLSLRTLDQLLDFRRRNGLDGLQVFPFFSMVDGRKKLHRQGTGELPLEHPDILVTRIPFAAEAERMGLERAPVSVYAPRSRAAAAFDALWEEIGQRIW